MNKTIYEDLRERGWEKEKDMKKCPNCRNYSSKDARFCIVCGYDFENVGDGGDVNYIG